MYAMEKYANWNHNNHIYPLIISSYNDFRSAKGYLFYSRSIVLPIKFIIVTLNLVDSSYDFAFEETYTL